MTFSLTCSTSTFGKIHLQMNFVSYEESTGRLVCGLFIVPVADDYVNVGVVKVVE